MSLSTAQLMAIAIVASLTWTNSRDPEYGRIVQNLFTSAKTIGLAGLIQVGLVFGRKARALHVNFHDMFRFGAFDP